MGSARYLRLFFLTAVLLLASVTGFNYYVDPFTYYHLPWTEINLSRNQRHGNPGLARNVDHEVVLIGTSYVMEMSPGRLSEIAAAPALNLSFTAGLVREKIEMARLVLEQGKARTIVMEMNFPSFAVGDRVSEYPEVFPQYLYTPRMEMPFRYLMSFDTLKHSFQAIDQPGRITLENRDQVGPMQYGREQVVEVWNRTLSAWDSKQMAFWIEHQRRIESPREILENRLVPLIGGNPEIHFDLFFPPNSVLSFLQQESMGADDFARWLAFRDLVAEIAGRFENVALHDFQADLAVMTELGNYRDLSHYNQRILDDMMTRLFAGESASDRGQVAQNSRELHRAVYGFGRDFCASPGVYCSDYIKQRIAGQPDMVSHPKTGTSHGP